MATNDNIDKIETPTTKAEETVVLDDAARIVNEREAENGPAGQSMATITELWNTYLGSEHPEISAEQAAVMLALLKVGRHAHGDNDTDDIVDIAGYSELAARMREAREAGESVETAECCINRGGSPPNKF
jgi:hypothetical protein